MLSKKRRLFLKKERSSKNFGTENREGLSYQSGCGYLNTSDLIDETLLIGDNKKNLFCIFLVINFCIMEKFCFYSR